MFAYRGITSLQKEKDISLSNEQVSKINEQIEKYTKKSVIYGSEVLSICNAIEDYSRKYPAMENVPTRRQYKAKYFSFRFFTTRIRMRIVK